MGVKQFAAKVNREIEFVFVLYIAGNKEKSVLETRRSQCPKGALVTPWDTFKACQYLNTNKWNYFTLKGIKNKVFYWKLHAVLKRVIETPLETILLRCQIN